jgi:hypothetical protein
MSACERGGLLKRAFCRLGLWLVDRYCLPAAPLYSARNSGPRLSEEARGKMLRRIAARLKEPSH